MDIDVTFLLQLGILLALMLVLERLLHRPLLTTLAARQQQTVGTLAETRALAKLTAADVATYEDRLAETRQRLHQQREAQRDAGRKEARRIEDAARDHLLRARQAARTRTDALAASALADLAPARAQWRRTLLGLALGRPEAN